MYIVIIQKLGSVRPDCSSKNSLLIVHIIIQKLNRVLAYVPSIILNTRKGVIHLRVPSSVSNAWVPVLRCPGGSHKLFSSSHFFRVVSFPRPKPKRMFSQVWCFEAGSRYVALVASNCGSPLASTSCCLDYWHSAMSFCAFVHMLGWSVWCHARLRLQDFKVLSR